MDTFSYFADDYQSGILDNDLDTVFQAAAGSGIILLPGEDRPYVEAKNGEYLIDDLLLPYDRERYKSISGARRLGFRVFPEWVTLKDDGSFDYNQEKFILAFLQSKKVTKQNGGFTMNGKPVSDQEIKDNIRRSLALIRKDPGSMIYGAFAALNAMCKEMPIAAEIPAWIVNNGINETAFAEYLIKKTGWERTGNIFRTANHQIVTYDEARRVIASEIAPYFPTDTQRKITSLMKIIRLYLPEAKSAHDFEPKSAKELSEEHLTAPAFVVNSILPVGLTVFAAAPKTGKSWLCLALADAIANGDKFLGFDTQRGSCLYAALEDSKFRIVSRLKKIGSNMPDSLKIVNNGAKRLDEGLLIQLESWIDGTPDARLIVIDTLARVRPTSMSGLDAYQQDTMSIGPLQELAINRGVSIVVVTHYSKTNKFVSDSDPFERITGSMGLFGVSDCAWLIYGKRGSEDLTFRTTGREAADNEFKISFNKDTCRWSLLGTSEAIEEQRRLDAYKANPIIQTIKAVVKENGRWEVTASEMILEISKRTQTFVGDARELGVKLAEVTELLVKDGIMCSKSPGGRRGRGYCFEPINKLI